MYKVKAQICFYQFILTEIVTEVLLKMCSVSSKTAGKLKRFQKDRRANDTI